MNIMETYKRRRNLDRLLIELQNHKSTLRKVWLLNYRYRVPFEVFVIEDEHVNKLYADMFIECTFLRPEPSQWEDA